MELRAWSDAEKAAYRWTVSSGAVEFQGGKFVWTMAGDATGMQSADGELIAGGAVAARCLVEVLVESAGPSNSAIPAPGVFVYLAGPGSELETLWRGLIPKFAALRQFAKPGEMPEIAFIDAARLDLAVPNAKTGPYVIASLRPLEQVRPPYLIADFTGLPAAPSLGFAAALVNLAGQQREWNPKALAALLDQMVIVMKGRQRLRLR